MIDYAKSANALSFRFRTEKELTETLTKISLARLRISRLEKLVKGQLNDSELVLTVHSDTNKDTIHNIIGECFLFSIWF